MKTKHIVVQEFIRFLWEHYDLASASSLTIGEFTQGYMNFVFPFTLKNAHEAKKYVAVFYNASRYSSAVDLAKLEACEQVAGKLATAGLPARTAVLARDGRKFCKYAFRGENNFFALYEYLPGEALMWESYTRRHLYALGATLKQIHVALKNETGLELPQWRKYLPSDSAKITKYFQVNSKIIKTKLKIELNTEKFQKILKSMQADKTTQVIHGDFVRSNVLFSSEKRAEDYEITGILDFEKCMYAPAIVDIARTLAFLLVDCKHKSESEIVYHFLIRGYGANDYPKYISLYHLKEFLLYFWTRDLWKFLTANPYESLHQNYHFTATVKYLQKYIVLT